MHCSLTAGQCLFVFDMMTTVSLHSAHVVLTNDNGLTSLHSDVSVVLWVMGIDEMSMQTLLSLLF